MGSGWCSSDNPTNYSCRHKLKITKDEMQLNLTAFHIMKDKIMTPIVTNETIEDARKILKKLLEKHEIFNELLKDEKVDVVEVKDAMQYMIDKWEPLQVTMDRQDNAICPHCDQLINDHVGNEVNHCVRCGGILR